MSDGEEFVQLPAGVLAEVAELSEADAMARLRAGGWWHGAAGMVLAQWALDVAEGNVAQARHALTLATLIAAEDDSVSMLPGQIAYAEARLAVHAGDLALAEAALRRAQVSWRSVDATDATAVAYARTFLGLTQVLTMQGRYDEAALAAQGAIDALQPLAADAPSTRMLLSRAFRNRANLFVYQEQHAAARDSYTLAMTELEAFQRLLADAGDVDAGPDLAEEFGHLALNLASAHTFLDAPDEAESLLRDAIARFDGVQDGVNRGRARTNLGRLYLRLGEYAAALNAFDFATNDLIGDLPVDIASDPTAELAALRPADELLLEHALGYLALNLLPEATLALARCERLFRATGQPYELAQSRYAQGVLWLQQGDFGASQAALDEALSLYDQLDNHFWRNRTQTARVRLALAQGDRDAAATLLDALLAAPAMRTAAGAVAWDLLGLVDVWLLRLQLWLDGGAIADAARAAQRVAELLGVVPDLDLGARDLGARDLDTSASSVVPFPHLVLRLLHARGRIAAAQGDDALARRHFSTAVALLDRQRASLPLEEVRTAYLDDKMALYSDLVISLLAAPLPSDDEVAAAFAVVERARSRALLERLLATIDDAGDDTGADEGDEASAQRAALRRQLHWLYNQLLGESGNRRLDGPLSREVAQHEAAIQQLEWRNAPLLAQAEPVHLAELQAILSPDQQAVVYYFAGEEVLAFVVARDGAQVVRRLTTVAAVTQAQAELRFQLGRAEMGAAYVARHQARLMRGVQEALHRLYQLLVAPLSEQLVAPRILLIPYGVLHLIPFHALWDGAAYWLEGVEVAYVPSASVAVYQRGRDATRPRRNFAGFAPYDERIPQAQAEIDRAATNFAHATRYHRDDATVANLTRAAATCDVLHLATHGLFRPDNSFFSAIKLADGWIDVREIYRLPVTAQLVVLSACESGVGDVRAGDEVVGLARGFLAAGAQSLVASLWNVQDDSAVQLMHDFYEVLQCKVQQHEVLHFDEFQGEGATLEQVATPELTRPAAALRAAQIKALCTGEHPYFWAPFFAIG